eukprot:gnl/MRDRNA2_/MRDRNA2_59138_c0_seq3.p1 gnl/MRDRNA2_/MRDRNA2_59138_c0~~gnl/MRDRNA2_/MRDRNA2_59138_c0_seq3.p1  ORF type:complete len:567 (-),score=112.32 gnl/MRDRNA2_/MRDRNA2_59138_c0_seq3:58-1725(-)
MADHVLRNGPQFEAMVTEKNRSNAQFSFMHGGEGALYYQQILATSRGTAPAAVENASAQSPPVTASASNTQSATGVPNLAEIAKKWKEPQVYPLPDEVQQKLNQFIASLQASASRDVIKNSRTWIESFQSNPQLLSGIAGALMTCITYLKSCSHRLHVMYMVHDVLQTEAAKKDANNPVASIFKPFLLWMMRPAFQLAEAQSSDEGQKLLRLLKLWVDRGILTSSEADEMRLLIAAKVIPEALQSGSNQSSAASSSAGTKADIANQIRGFDGVQPPARPMGFSGQMAYPGQQLARSGAETKTPEMIPVGVMATMLKQAQAKMKMYRWTFKPYRPLDPMFTPQVLPPMDAPTDRLMKRVKDFYADLKDDVDDKSSRSSRSSSRSSSRRSSSRSRSQSRSRERSRSRSREKLGSGFVKKNTCVRGDKCTYAHGEHEIGMETTPPRDFLGAPSASPMPIQSMNSTPVQASSSVAGGFPTQGLHGIVDQQARASQTLIAGGMTGGVIPVMPADFKKTKICSYWQQGMCQKAVCTFAHGEHEIGMMLGQTAQQPMGRFAF